MVDFERSHREEREARKHFSLSVVRRGAETVETHVYTFRGPYVKRCIFCDRRSERMAICLKCHLERSALEAIARSQENHKPLVDRTILPMGVSWGSSDDTRNEEQLMTRDLIAGILAGALSCLLVVIFGHFILKI